MATPAPVNPFSTGYNFSPSEVVSNVKLEDIVNMMVVNYPLLVQALANAGATDPNALMRIQNSQMQLRNADTGNWHTIWISGQPGEEELVIGQGTT